MLMIMAMILAIMGTWSQRCDDSDGDVPNWSRPEVTVPMRSMKPSSWCHVLLPTDAL